jgi:Tol biopolymer transport system component
MMAAPRITLWANLATVVLAGLLLQPSCRGKGPEEEQTPMLQTSPSVPEPAVEVRGRIVFQSDLDGDDDIYLLRGREVTKLTDNSWADRYPRWSPDGTKIAYVSNPKGNFDVFTMDDRGSRVAPVTDSPEDEVDVTWAPDGTGIACSVEVKKILGKARSVWHIDIGTGKRSRLIPGFSGSHQLPDLSPKPPRVAFTGKGGRGWDVFLCDLQAQSIRPLTRGGESCRPRFSPDGEQIVYVSSEADGKGDIWAVRADGTNSRRLTVRDDSYDYFPSWSPDGTQVVFCSNFKDKYADKGEWGLYVIDLSDGPVALLFDSPGRDVFPDWH